MSVKSHGKPKNLLNNFVMKLGSGDLQIADPPVAVALCRVMFYSVRNSRSRQTQTNLALRQLRSFHIKTKSFGLCCLLIRMLSSCCLPIKTRSGGMKFLPIRTQLSFFLPTSTRSIGVNCLKTRVQPGCWQRTKAKLTGIPCAVHRIGLKKYCNFGKTNFSD
jgi:hypothetical protein